MDFKALMSKQISQAKTVKSPSPANGTTSSKYLRRAELEAQRQAEYAAEQGRIEAERDERARKKRKLDEDEAEAKLMREAKLQKLAEETKRRKEEEQREEERRRRKRLGLPELIEDTKSSESTSTPDSDIEDSELRSALRVLNEPATLFDETHTARLKRYQTLLKVSLAPKFSNTPIPTTIPLLPEAEMRLPDTMPAESDTAAITHLYAQLASYFTLLLTEWSLALSSRSPTTSSSQTGIQAKSNYTTSIRDLTPLFRQFESRSLTFPLLTSLHEIALAIQKRRYVDANDAYLRLSIGKAAWPIGVTMVGIHERSAREKLHETDQTAHIMSDEVTRKWLQSVKRCLTFAQVRWEAESAGQIMG